MTSIRYIAYWVDIMCLITVGAVGFYLLARDHKRSPLYVRVAVALLSFSMLSLVWKHLRIGFYVPWDVVWSTFWYNFLQHATLATLSIARVQFPVAALHADWSMFYHKARTPYKKSDTLQEGDSIPRGK